MKTVIRIISLLLSVVIIISGCLIYPGAAKKNDEIETIISEFDPGRGRIMRTVKFFKGFGKVLKVLNSDSTPEIEFREGIAKELCDYIADNSSVDIIGILGNVPAKAALLEKCYTITNSDTTAIRNEIYKMRDEAYQQGDSTKGLLFYFLGAYLSVIESVDVYTVPFENGDSKVAITAVFMDGTDETIVTDICMSPEGFVYGPDQKGLQLLGFECSVYDLMIYATVNCWMHDFGFCLFYDFFCKITPFFNYNTRRFKFDYGDKEWMVQIWKGNYLVSNGAEVGVYNREPGSFGSYYDCYDGVLPMGLKLSQPDDVIFEIEQEHWWINGFKLSDELYSPSQLTMDFYIEFPEEEMAAAFADSVNNHYLKDASCLVDGAKVTVVW